MVEREKAGKRFLRPTEFFCKFTYKPTETPVCLFPLELIPEAEDAATEIFTPYHRDVSSLTDTFSNRRSQI